MQNSFSTVEEYPVWPFPVIKEEHNCSADVAQVRVKLAAISSRVVEQRIVLYYSKVIDLTFM